MDIKIFERDWDTLGVGDTIDLDGEEYIIIKMHDSIHTNDIRGNYVWATAEIVNDVVTVETMPLYLRESHRAAGNWGVYPGNGATRRLVRRDEAEEIVANDPDGYDHIID